MTIHQQMNQRAQFENAVEAGKGVDLTARHERLAAAFEDAPGLAMVIDEADTHSAYVPADATLYTRVRAGLYPHEPIDVGVHHRVGGNHDFANPGELLCAAIAACYDSCVRLICRRLGIELKHLAVRVRGNVDVRGTLKLDANVSVGFQGFQVGVEIDAGKGVPTTTVEAILRAAEDSCVVMQTIRTAPQIKLEFDIAEA